MKCYRLETPYENTTVFIWARTGNKKKLKKNKMFYFDNPENDKISEIILFNNIKTMQAT